jgi:hypothetical protein
MFNWPMAGGYDIAADKVGGIWHQRVKIGHGATGAFADASDTAPLPVKVVTGTGGGAGAATQAGSSAVTVATAGIRVRLPDNPTAVGVTVRARTTNTGDVYVGGADVNAANGFALQPGEAVSVEVVNTSALYIDADNSNAQVRLLWVGS